MGFLSSVTNSFNKTLNQLPFFSSFSGQYQQDDANEAAMRSWIMANDYNHPIKQMERLKAAGLNPLLVYGSGSVSGNTTGSPSLVGGGVSTGVESTFKGLGNIINLMQGEANLSNTQAQTQASTAAAGASSAQAANLQAQTSINEVKSKYEKQSLIADIDYKQALADRTRAEATLAQGEAEIFGGIGGTKGASTLGNAAGKVFKTIRGLTR